MGTLGMLLFVSPVQHRWPEVAAGLAEAAAAEGHRVRVFCLGDGVYNTSRRMADPATETVVHRFAALAGKASFVNCSTCARFRGVDDGSLIANAKNGTLEDLIDLISGSDRLLSFTQED